MCVSGASSCNSINYYYYYYYSCSDLALKVFLDTHPTGDSPGGTVDAR